MLQRLSDDAAWIKASEQLVRKVGLFLVNFRVPRRHVGVDKLKHIQTLHYIE